MSANHKNNHLPNRIGSSLQHGNAHDIAHQRWSRRSFLRKMGFAGAASMLLGQLPIAASNTSPLSFALNNAETNRILVLIRLKGGNDGLNTIIPLYDYSNYRNYRPTIGLKEAELIKINDAIGIPKTMATLHPFWQEGQMKVIHSVGYPDQNLSHFHSSDIWATGKTSANNQNTAGWYGRYIEQEFPDFLNNPPTIPPAIQIGGAANMAFNNKEMTNLSISVLDPEEVAEIAETGQLFSTNNLPECHYGEQVGFLRSVANNTFFYAETLSKSYKSSKNQVEYKGELGSQLATVARLIKGNLGTKLYMVSIDGFDTHANQLKDHPALLTELSNAIASFYKDLSFTTQTQEVLCCTFSEFGRRIEENGSAGTDHGAAAPMLLFGAGLNGNGFIGNAPNLQDVDEVGNLKFGTDFRSVYATLLENWLCVDSNIVDDILEAPYERIANLGLTCSQTTPVFETTSSTILHEARYLSNSSINIYYEIKQAANVNLQILNLLGQPIATLVNAYQLAGNYNIPFQKGQRNLARGQYFYRLQIGKHIYTNPFLYR
jgi:uncharacterized protein (DUF1501 family)